MGAQSGCADPVRRELHPSQVLSRIASQMPQDEKDRRADHTIINDDSLSLIKQVRELLG